jgi:hypothetical protein
VAGLSIGLVKIFAQKLYFQTAQEFKKFAQILEEKWQQIEPLILFPKWQVESSHTVLSMRGKSVEN